VWEKVLRLPPKSAETGGGGKQWEATILEGDGVNESELSTRHTERSKNQRLKEKGRTLNCMIGGERYRASAERYVEDNHRQRQKQTYGTSEGARRWPPPSDGMVVGPKKKEVLPSCVGHQSGNKKR